MRRPVLVSTAFSLAAALAIATAAPALAADPPQKPPEAAAKPAKEAKPKDKLVCSTQEVAGSLIPQRVCRTEKQAEAQIQASRDLNAERRENGGFSTEARSLTPSGGAGR